MAGLDAQMASSSIIKKKTEGAQEMLFSISVTEVALPCVPEWPLKERLGLEKEMMGVYISGHPLDRYKQELGRFSRVNTIFEKDNEEPIVVAGMITTIRKTFTKGGKPMAFLGLEDKYSACEVIAFPETYNAYEQNMRKDEIVVVNGEVSKKETEAKIIAQSILPIASATTTRSSIHLNLEGIEEEDLHKPRGDIAYLSRQKPILSTFWREGSLCLTKFQGQELILQVEALVGKERVWLD